MAINFIDVDRSSKFGGNLAELSLTLRRAREMAVAIQERMGHMNDGTNFAPVCTSYGLTPANNTVGSGALAVVNDVVTALAAAGVTTMIERVG